MISMRHGDSRRLQQKKKRKSSVLRGRMRAELDARCGCGGGTGGDVEKWSNSSGQGYNRRLSMIKQVTLEQSKSVN